MSLPIFWFKRTHFVLISSIWIFCVSCTVTPSPHRVQQTTSQELFELTDAAETGFYFLNEVEENEHVNIFTYLNFFNGAGVAIGDINNDKLPDIFMAGNKFGGRLFLNKGDFEFEQISETANVFFDGYTTGVTMADVNGDGYLDIYLCRSMLAEANGRKNLLLINNQDLTFSEQALQYGIADPGYSNHASFFDMDNDGDLDLYVLNHRNDFEKINEISPAGVKASKIDNLSKEEYWANSSHLYENNGDGSFTDVTTEAGVRDYSFGLSATCGDINMDGWMDLYIACDHSDKDHVYINNGDGTFTDQVDAMMGHIPRSSMGADISDVNHDGLPDIFVVDMKPEDTRRQKQLGMGLLSYDMFQLAHQYGYHYQIAKNCLQLNNGNGTFSEIADLSGISSTDWSWSPLIADFNNDTDKDIFVTNGYPRDITDLDFVKYLSDSIINHAGLDPALAFQLSTSMSSTPLPNYFFVGKGDLGFQNQNFSQGCSQPSFSNGAAYADFDLDGDLDLLVNNFNHPSFLYKNLSRENESGNHYFRVELSGPEGNLHAHGTKLWLRTENGLQYQEAITNHGFLSCSEPVVHFGIGKTESIQELNVEFPDGRLVKLYDLTVDQQIEVRYSDSQLPGAEGKGEVFEPVFALLPDAASPVPIHEESPFIDFKSESLLEQMSSNRGPFIAVGDVNGDQLDDFYMGGSAGNPGKIYLQSRQKQFHLSVSVSFEEDQKFEDGQSLFFDADQDGDLDLFVTSGSNEHASLDLLQNRLYLNDGKGAFSSTEGQIPQLFENSLCSELIDIDGDGDLDIFVGGHVRKHEFPLSFSSYLLENNNGTFTKVPITQEGEASLGIINDAARIDINQDGLDDLLLAGEWMGIKLLLNEGGKFKDVSQSYHLDNTEGLWYTIEVLDIDQDGDLDFVAGNRGKNTFFTVSKDRPAEIHAADFDQNGHIDATFHYVFDGGEQFPRHHRDELLTQIPGLKRQFPNYSSYSSISSRELLSGMNPEDIQKRKIVTYESSVFLNEGEEGFTRNALPLRAQFSHVMDVLPIMMNGEELQGLLLVGNNYGVNVHQGHDDASIGAYLAGTWPDMMDVPVTQSGFYAPGDTRQVKLLRAGDGEQLLLVSRNNASILFYSFQPNSL